MHEGQAPHGHLQSMAQVAMHHVKLPGPAITSCATLAWKSLKRLQEALMLFSPATSHKVQRARVMLLCATHDDRLQQPSCPHLPPHTTCPPEPPTAHAHPTAGCRCTSRRRSAGQGQQDVRGGREGKGWVAGKGCSIRALPPSSARAYSCSLWWCVVPSATHQALPRAAQEQQGGAGQVALRRIPTHPQRLRMGASRVAAHTQGKDTHVWLC